MNNILNRLETWRIERGLDVSQGFKFDLNKQVSFLTEEITEYLRANNDDERVDALCDLTIFSINAINLLDNDYSDLFSETSCYSRKNPDVFTIGQAIFTLAFIFMEDCEKSNFRSVIEITKGIIEDLGYDYFKAMNETLKEIESRKGAFNPESGKWEKFKDDESKKLWYKADYESCKL